MSFLIRLVYTIGKMSSNIMKNLVKVFPVLSAKNIKGQCGRVGVVGGSY
jgi:hypothetical protein